MVRDHNDTVIEAGEDGVTRKQRKGKETRKVNGHNYKQNWYVILLIYNIHDTTIISSISYTKI